MGKIVAIGGGENGRGEHPYETGPFDREIVRLTGKDDPNFLFIGLANSFADSYYATMCDIFHGRLGCTHTDHLTEADLRDPDTLRRKMEWADFIYVGGGNTLRLMTLLRRCGGDRLLDEAYKRGTVLSGVSAGGICWCSCGNSDSRKFTSGSDQLIKVTGLGYLPVLFCPHYDAEPLRQTDLPRMMRRVHGMPAIALDNGAALEVVDGQWRLLTSLPGARGQKCFWKDGTWHQQLLPADGVFRPLKELLTRNADPDFPA